MQRGTYFSFSCTDSKYLAFFFFLVCAPDLNPWPPLGLWSYSHGPLLKAAELAARLDPGLVIHWLLDRLPHCIDFCFPNLQERSKEKIKNTVRLKLNKNPAQGRYLREHGVTAEVHISLYRLNPSLSSNTIISIQKQKGWILTIIIIFGLHISSYLMNIDHVSNIKQALGHIANVIESNCNLLWGSIFRS